MARISPFIRAFRRLLAPSVCLRAWPGRRPIAHSPLGRPPPSSPTLLPTLRQAQRERESLRLPPLNGNGATSETPGGLSTAKARGGRFGAARAHFAGMRMAGVPEGWPAIPTAARRGGRPGGAQHRQIVLHGAPDAGAVDQRVAVDQDVAERHNLVKIGNLGRERRIEARELTKSLAENLELALHRGARDDIAVEICEALGRRHGGEGVRRIARVPEEAFGITLQRPAPASARRSPSSKDCPSRPAP